MADECEAPALRQALRMGLCCRLWNDVDVLLGFAVLPELHDTIGQGEKGIVTADADVSTRPKCRAALPNNNTAGRNKFAAEALHAEALRLAVASVTRAPYTFLVCHSC